MTQDLLGAHVCLPCALLHMCAAAQFAARLDLDRIDLSQFEAAIDRVIGGLEKKNKVRSVRCVGKETRLILEGRRASLVHHVLLHMGKKRTWQAAHDRCVLDHQVDACSGRRATQALSPDHGRTEGTKQRRATNCFGNPKRGLRGRPCHALIQTTMRVTQRALYLLSPELQKGPPAAVRVAAAGNAAACGMPGQRGDLWSRSDGPHVLCRTKRVAKCCKILHPMRMMHMGTALLCWTWPAAACLAFVVPEAARPWLAFKLGRQMQVRHSTLHVWCQAREAGKRPRCSNQELSSPCICGRLLIGHTWARKLQGRCLLLQPCPSAACTPRCGSAPLCWAKTAEALPAGIAAKEEGGGDCWDVAPPGMH